MAECLMYFAGKREQVESKVVSTEWTCLPDFGVFFSIVSSNAYMMPLKRIQHPNDGKTEWNWEFSMTLCEHFTIGKVFFLPCHAIEVQNWHRK